MDVSIVVLTWEDSRRTEACVRSLPAGAEVIVVDNGSGAPVAGALRTMCERTDARYVRSDENVGYARGMNLGLRYAGRSRVILANNDLVVRPDTVALLVAALDDPGVGAAFPAVRDPAGRDRTAAGRFLTLRTGLAHATGLNLLFPRLRAVAAPSYADWFSGPFVALRRRTLDDLGGVDESSFFYGEDLRLCWAVRQRGLRLAFVPDALITHEDDASARRRWSMPEIARRQTREYIRASRDLGGGRGLIACTAYVVGVLWRAAVGPGEVRRAIARGAVEGLRAR